MFPQGFQDHLDMFGKDLFKDILEFSYSQDTVPHYVDNIVCAQRSVLYILTKGVYKLSEPKLQLCHSSINLSLINFI